MEFDTSLTLLRNSLNNPKNNDAIVSLYGKIVFIYGAGNYGRIIYKLLIECGISQENILGFLDKKKRNANYFSDLPVKHPDDQTISNKMRKEIIVIISIYCSLVEMEKIHTDLAKLGYNKIVFCYDIAISFYKANDPYSRILNSHFFPQHIDNILTGASYWYDSRSIETYINHFMGYSSGNISLFLLENDHKQYFADFPISGKGYSRFVDCGAFTGDTIADLFQHCNKIEELFLFEPEADNLLILIDFLNKNKEKAEKIVLFPCGVWNQIEQVRFEKNGSAASAISNTGDSFIQCISIDAALTGFSPTFIKMDVEGAELEALHGAENTIKQNQPDLAICLYHSLTHFWEIPSFLKRICPEYKLFLRTYGAAGFETVLYAMV